MFILLLCVEFYLDDAMVVMLKSHAMNVMKYKLNAWYFEFWYYLWYGM